MNRLLITRRESKILSALWDGSRVLQFQAEEEDAGIRVGDIRVGRVSSYVKNIHAAFVEVMPGFTCFYQLKPEEKVRTGEEFPVQITREAVKTKMAVCSRDLSISGRYLVLVTDRCSLALSAKLHRDQREELSRVLSGLPEKYGVGFIVRTNAAGCDPADLTAEAEILTDLYLQLKETAVHRPFGTCLRTGMPAYLTMLQDAPSGSVEEIVTDIPEIYEQIRRWETGLPESDRTPLRLYDDPDYSMNRLYRLDHFLEEALNRRVWLPSGGYLVIDPTEALTVIDVNTGKYSGHKKKEEAILKIDLEACDAILQQLRLRNLSGIIVVDFIDLEDPEHQNRLYEYLKDCLRHDVVRSVLVDITPLHLAEITRKKVRGTLAEQLKPCRKADSAEPAPENTDPE